LKKAQMLSFKMIDEPKEDAIKSWSSKLIAKQKQ